MNTADYELWQAGGEAAALRIRRVREAHALRKAGRMAEAIDALDAALDEHPPAMAADALLSLREAWRNVQDGGDGDQEASPPRRSFSDFWLRTAGPVPGTKSTKVGK